jgi:inositol phosphorylceramide synthase catalytic subunit
MNNQNQTRLYWGMGSVVYFSWFYGIVGLRPEHVVLWVLVLVLWMAGGRFHRWLAALSVWLLYWVIYDSLRIAPNWTVNAVHIQDLYDLDKSWFGVGEGSARMTLNEWCAQHTRWWLDLMAGAFYISWVPLPFALGVWLAWKRANLYMRFACCFFLVNVLGFSIYYLCPAAPPWYVAEFGFGLNPDVPRSAAGLNRVDELLDMTLFKQIYTRNSNVFAAMPSLHSAYPLVAWFYARMTGVRWLGWLCAVVCVGIWLSAIYTNHHYVLDVLAGIGVAVAGYLLFEKVLMRQARFKTWIESVF